jgi:hypothetical protein
VAQIMGRLGEAQAGTGASNLPLCTQATEVDP